LKVASPTVSNVVDKNERWQQPEGVSRWCRSM
jgi:hypothetical protein